MPPDLHPYLDTTSPIAIAHRGGAGSNPENTMPAFEAARELGYRYLETDVHLTSDGVVVAFHDPDLSRVSDKSGRISELTWSEVSEATIEGSASVPRLADLLTAFPDARFNIDAKSDDVVEPLLDLIEEFDARHRVCIAAFSHARLVRIRRIAEERSWQNPTLCTSASQLGIVSGFLRSFHVPVPSSGADVLQAPHRFKGVPVVTARFVERARRDGMPVHVWTVDEPSEIEGVLEAGVAGVMTDEPETLKRVFEERGIWNES